MLLVSNLKGYNKYSNINSFTNYVTLTNYVNHITSFRFEHTLLLMYLRFFLVFEDKEITLHSLIKEDKVMDLRCHRTRYGLNVRVHKGCIVSL